jgi:hypothetical protein
VGESGDFEIAPVTTRMVACVVQAETHVPKGSQPSVRDRIADEHGTAFSRARNRAFLVP